MQNQEENMQELLRLARDLVEKFLGKNTENKQKLDKKYLFMFSIAKIILIKEKIIKKDVKNNKFFDLTKNKKYILLILYLAERIEKDGYVKYPDDLNEKIILLNNEKSEETKEILNLKKAVFIFQKLRDSFAHGMYTIDLENNSIRINNEVYGLGCSLEISTLISILFFVENEKENDFGSKWYFDFKSNYRDYIDSITTNYDLEPVELIDRRILEFVDGSWNYIYGESILNNNLNKSNDELEFDHDFSKFQGSFLSNIKVEDDFFINEINKLICLTLRDNSFSKKECNEIEELILTDYRNNEIIKEYIFNSFNEFILRLISEVSSILKTEKIKNEKVIIALYNYMQLLFSARDTSDKYEFMSISSLCINVTSGNDFGNKVEITKKQIRDKVKKFIKIMNPNVNNINVSPWHLEEIKKSFCTEILKD